MFKINLSVVAASWGLLPLPLCTWVNSSFCSVPCKLQSGLEFDSLSLLTLQLCKPLNVSSIVLHIFGFLLSQPVWSWDGRHQWHTWQMRDFLISVTASLFNSDALQPAKGVEEHREDLLRLKKLIFMQTSKLQGSLVAVAAVSILAGATTMWSLSFTVGKCPFLSSFLWLNILVLLQVPVSILHRSLLPDLWLACHPSASPRKGDTAWTRKSVS